MLILLESQNFFFKLFSNKHGFLNINTWKVLEQKGLGFCGFPITLVSGKFAPILDSRGPGFNSRPGHQSWQDLG